MSAQAQSLPAATAAEAAYVFGYPLVLMERLRVQAPPNRLVHASEPGEDEPDMLCSSAWLDLTEGPVVLSVPATHGHYYAATLVDMWAEVFASLGPRTTGTGAGSYALCGPGWTGTRLPPEIEPLAAPTSRVRLSIRTYAGAGAGAARAVQTGFDVRPLSDGQREPVAAELARLELARADVDALDGAGFFAELGRLAALHGGGPDIPADAAALEAGAARGRESVHAAADALFERGGGGWELCHAAGHYGGDYARRAAAAYAGVADRPAADRLIARLGTDADGVPFSGRRRYRMCFQDGSLPPVRAFWSLSANGHRGPGSSWSTAGGLALERDGALCIGIQSGTARTAGTPNWLRTPPGAFELVLRLTWPGDDALERRWSPPPVTREG